MYVIKTTIKKYKHEVDLRDFIKLYLISNKSGVNLPRLNQTQKQIVENVDKDELEGLNLLLTLAGEKEVKAAKIVTVKVEVTYNGDTVTEELPLVVVKQGLQWKILSID